MDDNTCTLCDDYNGVYVATHINGSCTWSYTISGDYAVVVTVLKVGSNYRLDVSIFFPGSGGGCTDDQTVYFRDDLGTTEPACLTGINGTVAFYGATNTAGNIYYTDPDAGCTVDGSTCSVTFAA